MKWKLNNREPIVRCYHSGPIEDYTVRILWSNKLGLCHSNNFSKIEEAIALVNKIKAKGLINTDRWIADYYPSKSYLETYAD